VGAAHQSGAARTHLHAPAAHNHDADYRTDHHHDDATAFHPAAAAVLATATLLPRPDERHAAFIGAFIGGFIAGTATPAGAGSVAQFPATG
jgi:hypothetical protein